VTLAPISGIELNFDNPNANFIGVDWPIVNNETQNISATDGYVSFELEGVGVTAGTDLTIKLADGTGIPDTISVQVFQ
jgi:hypothetical protein